MAKKIIGVFGADGITQAENIWQAAFIMGRLLAEQGFVVLTGGLGGVMEAASRGAREAGGVTVGILPGTRDTTPANQYVDIAVYTGMGEARNAINVKTCHAAIAIGGEYGTLTEIALALKGHCPLILLNSWHIVPYKTLKKQDWQLARSPEEAVSLAITAAETNFMPGPMST
jgi:uncharacterized protein (TIGR00725 family)